VRGVGGVRGVLFAPRADHGTYPRFPPLVIQGSVPAGTLCTMYLHTSVLPVVIPAVLYALGEVLP